MRDTILVTHLPEGGEVALVSHLLMAGLLVWFALLMALVAGRLALGEIATSGLLVTNTRGADSGVNPERVAAMAVFPAVLAFYVIHTLNTGVEVKDGVLTMPDVPESLIAILTGGNGLYLAGKLTRDRGGRK